MFKRFNIFKSLFLYKILIIKILNPNFLFKTIKNKTIILDKNNLLK
jgi:hypothetical protein